MHWLLGAIPPIALSFVLIVAPLIGRFAPGENGFRVFWPAIFAITVVLAAVSYRRLTLSIFRAPPIVALLLFLAFAGAGVNWALSPDHAMTRWVLQMMVIATIIVPLALARPSGSTIEQLHWCFLTAMIIAAGYVNSIPPMQDYNGEVLGHPGYFFHKQYLGMYASIALLIAVHELFQPWRRRALAIITIAVAAWLLLESKSKSALGFLLLAPMLALLAMIAAQKLRRPLLLIVLMIPLSWYGAAMLITNLSYRISYHLTGDPTFTGRTVIWDFISTQISKKPWFGWGFQSFWEIGPMSPAVREGPAFVKTMSSSHSGYMDVRLETGIIGLSIFLVFIAATFHVIGRIMNNDPVRAWLLLSIGLYTSLANLLDTYWLIPHDAMWLLFLIVVAEASRPYPISHRQAQPLRNDSRWRPARRLPQRLRQPTSQLTVGKTLRS